MEKSVSQSSENGSEGKCEKEFLHSTEQWEELVSWSGFLLAFYEAFVWVCANLAEKREMKCSASHVAAAKQQELNSENRSLSELLSLFPSLECERKLTNGN